MLRISRPLPSRRRESTIALINIVFLMLIFFLIAGTLAPPMENKVDLISTEEAERAEVPYALFVTREGELRADGQPTDAAAYVAAMEAERGEGEKLQVKLAADKNLPATQLIEIVAQLRQAGAAGVSIVTERAVP